MPARVPARLAIAAAVVGLLLVPLAGCTFSQGTTIQPNDDGVIEYPDPPSTLSVETARQTALRAEAATLSQAAAGWQDVDSIVVDPATTDPLASAARIGDAVYVYVAYPYTVHGEGIEQSSTSRASYVVTERAIERIDHDHRSVSADTFTGGQTVEEPIDLVLVNPTDQNTSVQVSLTYLGDVSTAYVGSHDVDHETGMTVEGVTDRAGQYRVTVSAGSSSSSSVTTVSPDSTGPLVVTFDSTETVRVLRVDTTP